MFNDVVVEEIAINATYRWNKLTLVLVITRGGQSQHWKIATPTVHDLAHHDFKRQLLAIVKPRLMPHFRAEDVEKLEVLTLKAVS